MPRPVLPILLALLLAGTARAEEPAEGIRLDVHEATLDNGLRLLLVPRKGSPRVACRVVFRVGSVSEHPGLTGISHLLEHMMFKGTERIGTSDWSRDARLLGEIDAAWASLQVARRAGDDAAVQAAGDRFRSLVEEERRVVVKDELWSLYQAAGGTGLNAWTSEDVTGYIVTLPSNRVELFFWLESDRMASSVSREFYSEREVVKEERRLRTDNTPTGPFEETLNALAYTAHPYRWPVVGWMSDLDAITRRGLDEYRRTYYTPRNAVVCLVGDLDPDRCLELARTYFGPLASGPEPPPVATVEPPQKGRKLYEATARAAPQVQILHHAPAFDHPDAAPLRVLASLLSGETGRLHERLVRELGIARSAGAFYRPGTYPGLLSMEAVAAGDTDPADLLAALEQEVRRMQNEPVDASDLVRVKNQSLAGEIRMLRSPGFLGMRLAVAEARRSWRDLGEQARALQAVTAEDVRRVARAYLVRENSTVGLLRREEKGGER